MTWYLPFTVTVADEQMMPYSLSSIFTVNSAFSSKVMLAIVSVCLRPVASTDNWKRSLAVIVSLFFNHVIFLGLFVSTTNVIVSVSVVSTFWSGIFIWQGASGKHVFRLDRQTSGAWDYGTLISENGIYNTLISKMSDNKYLTLDLQRSSGGYVITLDSILGAIIEGTLIQCQRILIVIIADGEVRVIQAYCLVAFVPGDLLLGLGQFTNKSEIIRLRYNAIRQRCHYLYG